MRSTKKGLLSLERIVTENNLRHECLVLLAKKLQGAGNCKALVSATRLCCKLAGFIPAKFVPDVSKILNENAAHKSVLVRKETAASLKEVLVEAGPYEFVAINNLKKLVKDPQDCVKVTAVESLCSKAHSRNYFMASIYNVLLGCLDQKSWRTRFVLVRQMPDILASTEPKSRRQMTAFYFKCLNDPEMEVAIKALEALKSLPALVESDELNEKVLPELQKAASNESADVRKALAGSLPHLCPAYQKFAEPANTAKSLVWQLFKDENPDVRIALFSNLEPFLRAQSVSGALSSVSGVLTELLGDKSWKVRQDTTKVIEMILIKFPEETASNEQLIKALGEKLSDRVAVVRKTAITSVKAICSALGLAWSEKHGVGLFRSFAGSLNYLYRLNFLFGISEICRCVSSQTLSKEVDLILKLGKDSVANVRMNSLIAMIKISQKCDDKGIGDKAKRLAEELSADQDAETQKLAQKATAVKDWKLLADQFAVLAV